MCTLTDINCVNLARPDYIGYIFVPGRWRCISPETAKELSINLLAGIKVAGVFVNEDPLQICRIASMGFLDAVQLHGQESMQDIQILRSMLKESGCGKVQIWKAFRIETADDIRMAKESIADMILLDCGSGGSGRAFDWTLLMREGIPSRPWFLAGGLKPDNVGSAIDSLHPWGVDVSSGVETNKAKDPDKIRRFMEQVRGKADSD